MLFRYACIAFVMLMTLGALPCRAEPFVYQGRLDASGQAATGRFDFQFEYYGTPTGGIVALTFEALDVQVTDGLFAVELPEPPTLQRRWLEISVRPHGAPVAYTALTPRSFIGAAPVATTSLDQPWISTASGLTYGDGDEIVLLNRTNRIGNEFFGVGADTSGFGGMYISTTSEDGEPFYGYSAGGGINAFHYFDGETGRMRLTIAGREAVNVDSSGNTVILGTIQADSFEFSSPEPDVVSVPPAAFRPANQVSFVPYVAGGTAASAYVNQPTSLAVLVAPVSLPDGATVTELTSTMTDLDSGRQLVTQLARISRTGGGQNMALVSTGTAEVGTYLTKTDDSILVGREVVDNVNYSYEIWVNPSFGSNGWPGNSNLAVNHVQVTYTLERAR